MTAAKIKPLDLAALTLLILIRNFKHLVIAFAALELLRCLVYFFDSWLAVKYNMPMFFPWWIMRAFDLLISSAILVLMVQYLVLGRFHRLIPRALPLKPIAMVALIMVPLWLLMDTVTDLGNFLRYYDPFAWMLEGKQAERTVLLFVAYSFVLHAVLVALIYPLFGVIACTGDFKLQKYGAWLKWQFVPFFGISILLIASLETVRNFYAKFWQSAGNNYFPASSLAFDLKSEVLAQLRFVPMDFLYAAIPAAAVSLIFLQLRKSDPTL